MLTLLRWLCWTTIAWFAIACGGGWTKTAELRGYVRLADGSPVVDVRMVAHWPDNPEMGSMETTTNPDGYFRLISTEYTLLHANWRHIAVTPQLAGYAFEPATLDIFLAHEEQYADFVARPARAPATTTLLMWWTAGTDNGLVPSAAWLVEPAR